MPLSEGQPVADQDPISALKSIFGQTKKIKRAPIDINPIMTKYLQKKQPQTSKNRTFRSENFGHGNEFNST